MKSISIDPKYKIEQATSKDVMRYSLTDPNYNNGILRATDGHIAVHVCLGSDQEFPNGNIPREVFLRGRKNGHGNTFTISTTDGDKDFRVNGERVLFERPPEIAYPNTAKVVDEAIKSRGDTIIAINPELLMRLANAMGSPKCLILRIGKVNESIGVVTSPLVAQACDNNGFDHTVEGVMMPMQISVKDNPRWKSLETKPVEAKVEAK